jgi:sugar/nucleoside kinase (ribokinase family)
VRVVSVAGEDFPEEGRSGLARRNVDLAGLEVVPGGKTFRWAGRYSADMNERETLLTELNVLGDFEPKLPGEYKATPYVFLANGPTATQHAVLDQLETKAYVAADTMNLWINTERDELMRLLSRIDLLILNDEEARMIFPPGTTSRPARSTLRRARPLLPSSGKSSPATLTTRTGAGDSFAGAFMGYLARAESTEPPTLRAALAVASVVASFTCESFGPKRLLEVTMDEVNSRLESLRELVAF